MAMRSLVVKIGTSSITDTNGGVAYDAWPTSRATSSDFACRAGPSSS